MSFLSAYERRILAAFADAILPPTELFSETIADLGLLGRVEEHVALCSRNIRWAFRMALVGLDFQARLRKGRGFASLEASQRLSLVEAWRTSRLYPRRLLFKLLESSCDVVYYSHPSITKKIGYAPPPVTGPGSPPAYSESPDRDLFIEADVCIIGSGAGGAVVAKELAEKGRSVVILEEGDYYGLADFGREALEIVERLYHNAGMQMTLGFPCILLPTGRAVGGTTIINSGTCLRLPERILSRWQEEFGLTDLTPEALGPYFDRVERHLHVEPVSEEVLGSNAKIFRRGLEGMGLKGFPLPRNATECRGSGMCCFGCPTDAKQSVNLSYIPRAVAAGAKLFVRCKAETIVPKQGHGGEVFARFLGDNGTPGRRLHVAVRAVILAAGTLQTPYLLKRSRIARHNRHVGRHLTIHPTGKIIGLFEEEVRAWEGVPQGFGYDGLSGEGMMFEGAFTPPSFGSIYLGLPPLENKRAMERYNHLASFGFLISDEARGSIHWLPNGDPLIFYRIRRHELQQYLKGIRFLTEVFLKAGAKEIYTGLKGFPVITPQTGIAPFENRTVKPTDLEIAAFHPLGTCRMAADPDRGVVDGFGQVHGVKNLFIADGSVFPSSLGVNPQETIMAFADRTADHIHRTILS